MGQPVPGENWNYSGDPNNSDLDAIRFLAEDNDSEMPWLSDDEINYLLAKWQPLVGSNTYVASVVAGVISRKLAGFGSVNAGGVSVDLSTLSQRYADVARELREEFNRENSFGEPEDSSSDAFFDISFDPSIRPLSFAVGMHDNPDSGQQDFGGWISRPFDWISG